MGAATAHSFAQAGASRIALLGRREKPLLETKASIHAKFPGIEIFTAPTDVTKKEQVDAAFANFLPGEKTRTLDILVHCAAIIGPQDPIATAPTEAFLAAVHANVSGALHVAQAFTRHATPGASVAIEVNSGAAHMNFVAAFGAYSVAKLAAFRVWDSLGYASKGEGVRVYHVQPGVLDTEMGREGGSPQALGYADDRT
jgi:NAD(P)-dependent dehydrogenase (short-subunit alcohol dehydrogenase family)